MQKSLIIISLWLAGCAGSSQTSQKASPTPQSSDYATQALQMLRADFKSQGAATMEKLLQRDAVQQLCSSTQALNAQQAQQLEAEQLATISFPADKNWLGDWKRGEAIAQNGRGLQSSDAAGGVNGGNCYACHQITKAEISFGNIGPSLYRYGKLRGDSEAVRRYTWGKLYNPQAYRACSVMPRFGQHGILNEQQLKDVMALLLDPASPTNQ